MEAGPGSGFGGRGGDATSSSIAAAAIVVIIVSSSVPLLAVSPSALALIPVRILGSTCIVGHLGIAVARTGIFSKQSRRYRRTSKPPGHVEPGCRRLSWLWLAAIASVSAIGSVSASAAAVTMSGTSTFTRTGRPRPPPITPIRRPRLRRPSQPIVPEAEEVEEEAAIRGIRNAVGTNTNIGRGTDTTGRGVHICAPATAARIAEAETKCKVGEGPDQVGVRRRGAEVLPTLGRGLRILPIRVAAGIRGKLQRHG